MPFLYAYLVTTCVVGACLASFAHAMAVRLLSQTSPLGRSRCPHCTRVLTWYELIPLISWIALRGSCLTCRNPISWWYIGLEIFGTVVSVMVALTTTPIQWLWFMLTYVVPLMITIRTDGSDYLIFDIATRWMIPFALLGSIIRISPLALTESILGGLIGVLFLQSLRLFYYAWRNIEGIGRGDIELIAFIGATTGAYGIWLTLLCSSIAALLAVVGDLIRHRYAPETAASCHFHIQIPFGVFLAIGGTVALIALTSGAWHFVYYL